MKTKIRGVVGESSVVLHYGNETITIQAQTDRLLFEEFKQLIRENQEKVLIDKFLDVRSRIDKYTDKTFYVSKGQLYLKGDDTAIPDNIAKKLLELEAAGEDFMPLIRFWKKLKTNPSQESIEQLYGFIQHNNIPITEMGDIVTEKGVNQKFGAPVGELVDCRTGAVDNSVGMEVSMKREDVDDNPNNTCSHGLHVGAPDYVRRHYGGNILVQCIVNPCDVVSVPTDYNNTKMRVCRYIVAGYAEKSNYKPVYKFSDFINTPSPEQEVKMKSLSSQQKGEDRVDEKVTSVRVKLKANKNRFNKWLRKFEKMTSQEIKDYISDNHGVTLPHSNKSKRAIMKRAAIICANNEEINS